MGTAALGLSLGAGGPACVVAPWVAAGAYVVAPAVAQADAPTDLESLRALSRALRTTEGRAAALTALCELPRESLPAIRARTAELALRPTGDAGYAALVEFGEAASAVGPNDPRDLLPGMLALPAARFRAAHASVAERTCLLRSLERMGTADALVVAGPLLTTDMRAMRWQARHLVRRAGRRATAMVLRAASHPSAEVELWSSWALTHLGIRDSGDAVQNQTEDSLIAVLRSYAALRHIGGMPVVASFVDDPRVTVRTAAREALATYGDNATWELRRLHAVRLGRDPGAKPPAVLLRDLARELDARREAPLVARARRALAHERAGRHEEAAREADALLADAPVSDAARTLVPHFEARADRAEVAGRLADARRHTETAARLATGSTRTGLDARRVRLEEARRGGLGLVEEAPADPRLALAGHALRLHERRRMATVGFVLGALVLAGPALMAVLRQLGLRLGARTRTGIARLVRWYRDGGADALQGLARQTADAGRRAARALVSVAQTVVVRADESVRAATRHVHDALRAPTRASSPQPPATHAPVVEATAPPASLRTAQTVGGGGPPATARDDADGGATRVEVARATAEPIARPRGPSALPAARAPLATAAASAGRPRPADASLPRTGAPSPRFTSGVSDAAASPAPTHQRRPRPTRKAVAEASLFTQPAAPRRTGTRSGP